MKSPTGRPANKGPNIQNIPIRTDEVRKIRDALIKNMTVTPEFDGSAPFNPERYLK